MNDKLSIFLEKEIGLFDIYHIDQTILVVKKDKMFDGDLSNDGLYRLFDDIKDMVLESSIKDNIQYPKTSHKDLILDETKIPNCIFVLVFDNTDCQDFCQNIQGQGFDFCVSGFSVESWQACLESLPSVSDLLAFLAYQRYRYPNTTEFSTKQILHHFLYGSEFYHRAWQVEKRLQKFDYMTRVSIPIKSAVYKKQDSITVLVERQLQLTPLWHKAVLRWQDSPKYHFYANKQLSQDKNYIAKVLTCQSGYTAMKIVEFILGYSAFDDHQKAIGAISHEHSYHRFGQHFVLMIYALDEQEELHKNNIRLNHSLILEHYANELKDKEVKEIVMIGFDLFTKDSNGNIVVNMDIYLHSIN